MEAHCSNSHQPLLQRHLVNSVQQLLNSCSQGIGQQFLASYPEVAGEFATPSLLSGHRHSSTCSVLALTLTHTLFAQATRVPAHLMMGIGPSPAWMMLSFAPSQPWTLARHWYNPLVPLLHVECDHVVKPIKLEFCGAVWKT